MKDAKLIQWLVDAGSDIELTNNAGLSSKDLLQLGDDKPSRDCYAALHRKPPPEFMDRGK